MYKESWGLKRICPMCSKQYYDLGRTELECPECGKEIEVTTLVRPRRGRKPGSTNTAPLVNRVDNKTKEKDSNLVIAAERLCSLLLVQNIKRPDPARPDPTRPGPARPDHHNIRT